MGVVSSLVFAARNMKKCANGEGTRGTVALCQTVNTLDTVVDTANATGSIFGNMANSVGTAFKTADDAVGSVFSKVGKTEVLENATKTTGAHTKVGALAQKAVNPLLCVAAGVRVLKDEDQYAALIEETAAMGAMFGCESLMKYVRQGTMDKVNAIANGRSLDTVTFAKSSEKLQGLAKKTGKLVNSATSKIKINSKNSKAAKTAANYLDDIVGKLAKKVGKSKGKAFLVGAILDLLFVGGSILAYGVGKNIGKKLSNRDEQK